MNVVVFHNLVTQEGRRAIEVRGAAVIGNMFISNANSTIYSCAYDCPLGERLAMVRASDFCKAQDHNIVHFETRFDSRAAWQ